MVVLFDLDDTLLDHTTAVRAAAIALHRELGVSRGIDEFLVAGRSPMRGIILGSSAKACLTGKSVAPACGT
jgi:FMN phosphatase YigB (HAD superfamily)